MMPCTAAHAWPRSGLAVRKAIMPSTSQTFSPLPPYNPREPAAITPVERSSVATLTTKSANDGLNGSGPGASVGWNT